MVLPVALINVLRDVLKDFAPVQRIDSVGIRRGDDHDLHPRRDEDGMAMCADAHVAVITGVWRIADFPEKSAIRHIQVYRAFFNKLAAFGPSAAGYLKLNRASELKFLGSRAKPPGFEPVDSFSVEALFTAASWQWYNR